MKFKLTILLHDKKVKTITRLFFFLKQTHTQGKGKGVLTQKHTTNSLKSHGNF